MFRQVNTRSLGFTLALIVANTDAAIALDVSKLQGELFIAGATTVDPPANEPKNTHAYVTITGPSALRLYQNMRAKAEDDLCQDGHKLKRTGKLSCSVGKNGKEASCDFALDLVSGQAATGRAC